MTNPQPGEPEPVEPDAPDPGPPEPAKPEPGEPGEPRGLTPADRAALERSIGDERRQRLALQKQLDELHQQNMSDQEKAVATAKAEGRAEAEHEAALHLAAAEFRFAAAGRIADPGAALELLDVAKLLTDGQPDPKAIAAAIERLAGPAPEPPRNGARVPAGPRQSQGADGDILRAALRGHP